MSPTCAQLTIRSPAAPRLRGTAFLALASLVLLVLLVLLVPCTGCALAPALMVVSANQGVEIPIPARRGND